MKKISIHIFILFILAFIPLSADERIAGTLNSVDLLVEDLYNDDNHNYGEKYYVINRGKTPMRISIKLTSSENIEDHLANHTLYLEPQRKADIGYILQKDLSRGASWKYEWKALNDSY